MNKHFNTGLYIAAFFFIFLLGYIFFTSKTESFLIINQANSIFGDYFFYTITIIGNGVLWAGLILYAFFRLRSKLVFIIITLLLTTLTTKVCKVFIFPNTPRPQSLIEYNITVHHISWDTLYSYESFPSGHTAQAFAMCFVLLYLFPNRKLAFILPFAALLIGYSRIYLGQHYPIDILGGMMVGILCCTTTIILLPKKYK